METQIGQSSDDTITQLDDVAKSFQREAEALREIVRNRDQVIKSLKDHSACLRDNFKTILEAVVERVVDSDIQHHARNLLEQIEQAGEAVNRVGSNGK